MSWNGRPVLVTGAGGFIGSHLVERLVEAGASVSALVHYNALGRRGWLDASVALPLAAAARFAFSISGSETPRPPRAPICKK